MTATTNRKPIDMAAFMSWLPTFGRKFEVADVQRQPRLYQAAIEYARSYTGSFDYMVEMKDNALRFNSLTVGQAKGVLNCARAEALRKSRANDLNRTAPTTVAMTAPKRGITVEPMAAHDARFQAMLDREGVGSGSAPTPYEVAQANIAASRPERSAAELAASRAFNVAGRLAPQTPDIDYVSDDVLYAFGGAAREDAMYEEAMERAEEAERAAEAAMSAYASGYRERLEQPEPFGAEAYDPQYNAPAPAAPIENGTYTVVFGSEEDRITLRIADPKWMTDNTDNVQAVSYLYGPDNSNDYKGIGFLRSGRVAIWRSARPAISAEFEERINDALAVIAHSDQAELREAYALRSGRCARCGRKLTVPASIHRGVGPECAKHYL